MQNVVTSVEIRKFQGMKEAVFPAGTIVTPAARDWAKEQGIAIVCGASGRAVRGDTTERQELLEQVVRKVGQEFTRAGRPLDREELGAAVWACLGKLKWTRKAD